MLGCIGMGIKFRVGGVVVLSQPVSYTSFLNAIRAISSTFSTRRKQSSGRSYSENAFTITVGLLRVRLHTPTLQPEELHRGGGRVTCHRCCRRYCRIPNHLLILVCYEVYILPRCGVVDSYESQQGRAVSQTYWETSRFEAQRVCFNEVFCRLLTQ